jgi:serine/threonine-protein kinase
LNAALQQRVAVDPPEFQPVLAVRERWGRFLLSQGDLDGAEAQFREVVARDGGRRLSHTALARGGLARVALARNDRPTAATASDAAQRQFEAVRGFRDVRMGPYLWLIQSEVLHATGRLDDSRQWAQRALEASLRYDDPTAPSIRAARAALAAAASATTAPTAGKPALD